MGSRWWRCVLSSCPAANSRLWRWFYYFIKNHRASLLGQPPSKCDVGGPDPYVAPINISNVRKLRTAFRSKLLKASFIIWHWTPPPTFSYFFLAKKRVFLLKIFWPPIWQPFLSSWRGGHLSMSRLQPSMFVHHGSLLGLSSTNKSWTY